MKLPEGREGRRYAERNDWPLHRLPTQILTRTEEPSPPRLRKPRLPLLKLLPLKLLLPKLPLNRRLPLPKLLPLKLLLQKPPLNRRLPTRPPP